MKKVFLNKYIIIVIVGFILVGVCLDIFSINQHKFYTKNKDYIVFLDAKVSNITESRNLDVDNDNYYKYTIALSYTYNGESYEDKFWKDVTGNDYDNLHYKVDDTVKIVIFSHTPSEIISDDPDYVESCLQESKSYIPYFLLVAVCIYILLVIFLLLKNLLSKTKDKKHNNVGL